MLQLGVFDAELTQRKRRSWDAGEMLEGFLLSADLRKLLHDVVDEEVILAVQDESFQAESLALKNFLHQCDLIVNLEGL